MIDLIILVATGCACMLIVSVSLAGLTAVVVAVNWLFEKM